METCLFCNKTIAGRTDKKYCSDKCRAAAYYKSTSDITQFKRHVHSILSNNRDILSRLNPQGKTVVSKADLDGLHFNFKFFTSVYRTKKGHVYWFCYDQGYRKLQQGEKFLLIKWQDYMW